MMKKWIVIALLLIVPAMMFTVSCAKKQVQTEPTSDEMAAEEAAKQAEMERQAKLEEERLAAEMAAAEQAKMMAMDRFVNENIHFDFDDATLTEQAQELLNQKAMWLQNNPDANVTIEGHCDERGTNAYNMALGERRAESVKAFLVNLGISDTRMTTISYGEEKPIDPGHNEDAWAKNRRVALVLE